MRKTLGLLVIIITVSVFSCQTNEPEKAAGPLEGVWELVSAEWAQGDSITPFPNPDISEKSIKFYSGSHFFVIGNIGTVYSVSGTYTVDGNECIEVIDLNSAGMSPGDEFTINFVIEDNILNLESDWFKETWKRLE
jgi:hypothetical protein